MFFLIYEIDEDGVESIRAEHCFTDSIYYNFFLRSLHKTEFALGVL